MDIQQALVECGFILAPTKTLSPQQVKEKFRAMGKTISQWATEHNYPRTAVYRVINGFDKATFGRAHKIAVDLGLKPQTETE